MQGNQEDIGACQASPATASAPASQAEPCGLGQSCSPHGAEEELQHFILCNACGEAIDCRDLGQVIAHEIPNHQARRPS